MMDEPDCGKELHIESEVLVKKVLLDIKNIDFVNNPGVLSVIEHKSDLGKCIEWNQCEFSIESDDQEWAIVKDSKNHTGTSNENSKNTKSPIIQIPIKNIVSFEVSNNDSQLTFFEKGGSILAVFNFYRGRAKLFADFLAKLLNTSVSKRHLSSPKSIYIIRDQKEVQVLEKSFAELDLFTDDNTRSDAIWGFIKKLHENPYETTWSAFAKVTDAFTYKGPAVNRIEDVPDIFNKSLLSEEFPDFHGRISTEDYELITRGPPLPPRTFPCRNSPLTKENWSINLDDNGRILEHELIKEIIFHGGIDPDMDLRSEVWKFLLDYYPWNSTFAEREIIKKEKAKEYFVMKLQWETMTVTQEDNFTAYKERKSLVEKDVFRTDRNEQFFAGDNNSNLNTLQNILMTYVMYNFDLGYVQGMSDLLSPLLLQLRDEVDTFWCFVGFMNKVYRNFDMDQAGMKEQLHQLYCLLCCIEPELASYLEHHESSNMSFCFRWLLIWFKREFDYNKIFILWEVLWTEALCKNFHLLVCAAILDTEKETIMSNNYGFSEILKHVNELANHINLDVILRKAEGIYYQLSTAAKIPPAIREIIGLPPLPERENNCNENFKCSGNSLTPNNQKTNNQDTICVPVDHNELSFENSISLQYL